MGAISTWPVSRTFFIRYVMRGHLRRNELIGVLIIEDAATGESAGGRTLQKETTSNI